MTFVQWVEYHAKSIIFVALALSVAGAFAATSLPVGLFPQVAFPRVQVSLDSGDRPADQMAQLVTRPVEEALRVIPGVQDVTLRLEPGRRANLGRLRLGTRHDGGDLAGRYRPLPHHVVAAARHHIGHPAHGTDGVPHHRLWADIR